MNNLIEGFILNNSSTLHYRTFDLTTLRKILTFAVLILLAGTLFSCNGASTGPEDFEIIDWENHQIIPANDSHLKEETRERYQISAKKIALRHIHTNYPEKIDIPEPLAELFYYGLIHIVNSFHPVAKFVTRELNIHATQPASPFEIMVVIDTVDASGWIDSWRNGETMTGDTNLDELMDEFEYELKTFHELSSMDMSLAILRTDRLLNGYATGKRFKKTKGITNAAPEGVAYIGFRKDIEAELFEDHLLYRFIGGNAKFRVYSNGSVEFAGELGGPVATN